MIPAFSSPKLRLVHRLARGWLAAVLLVSSGAGALAQALPGAAPAAGAPASNAAGAEAPPNLLGESRAWLDKAVADAQPAGGVPLRMEVQVGALDSRLRLAPCSHVEPYVPNGTRLWGRSRLGLRCVEGPVRWNVFLPVQIKAWGPAWVLKRDVAAGAVLTEDDALQAEVDWADQRQAVLADLPDWLGQTAQRQLSSGESLRQGMIRATQVFPAGSQVRIVAQGPGFAITSDALAITPGVVGAQARVRTESGRILSGTVLDMRTVRVDL